MMFLLPRTAPGLEGALAAVARVGRGYPALLAVALFLLFSWMASHWRSRLPGWRDLSAAPARLAVGGLAPAVLAAHRRRELAGIALTIALASGAAVLLRSRVAEPYTVSSASMLPTLEPADEVLGNKLAYGTAAHRRPPRRGDVVVFQSSGVALGATQAPPVLIKRVVGLPGDRIQMQGGIAIINGWRVPTCDAGAYIYPLSDGQGGAFQARMLVEFLDDRAYLTVHSAPREFPYAYEVKQGEVFVLGDNRSNSLDSRAWNDGRGGGVPLEAIDAKAQWFLAGTHLDGRVDWQRTLRPLDAVATRLHIEAIDRRPLDEEIARCLRNPPRVTRPPPSDASDGISTSEGARP